MPVLWTALSLLLLQYLSSGTNRSSSLYTGRAHKLQRQICSPLVDAMIPNVTFLVFHLSFFLVWTHVVIVIAFYHYIYAVAVFLPTSQLRAPSSLTSSFNLRSPSTDTCLQGGEYIKQVAMRMHFTNNMLGSQALSNSCGTLKEDRLIAEGSSCNTMPAAVLAAN